MFTQVVNSFLWNYIAGYKIELVESMLSSFCQLDCKMSIKVHYLQINLDCFLKNQGDLGEKQSDRFYQDLRIM